MNTIINNSIWFVCVYMIIHKSRLIIPTWKWHSKELHESILAIVAILFTTSKVVRPPLIQRNLKPSTFSLGLTCQYLGFAEVTGYVAPQVRQQVHAVAGVGPARWIILEHCSVHEDKLITKVTNVHVNERSPVVH